MKEIKWIFFDIGGVLGDESEFLKIRQLYNLETLQKYQPEIILMDVKNIWPEASRKLGSLDENVIMLLLKDKSKLSEAVELMKEKRRNVPRYYDLLTIRPEATEVLTKLSKKYNLGILANQNREAKEKLKEAGIVSLFNNADVSVDFKLSKPDPEYFKKVFEVTGANPKDSVLVDDNIERGLLPAKDFGMTTVWYKNETREIDKEKVDYIITSLYDLLKIFLCT